MADSIMNQQLHCWDLKKNPSLSSIMNSFTCLPVVQKVHHFPQASRGSFVCTLGAQKPGEESMHNPSVIEHLMASLNYSTAVIYMCVLGVSEL